MSRLLSVFLSVVAICVVVSPVRALADNGPVVATVNGSDIHLKDIEEARMRLPERLQKMPVKAVFGLIVSSLVDSKLVATKARKEGLQDDAAIKRQMMRIEDQLLERVYLTRYIEARVSDKNIKDRYEDMVRDLSGGEEVHARHILLKEEAKALEVLKMLNDGGDFNALAKEHSQGPSAVNGGDLGYFKAGQMVPVFSDAAFALEKGGITKSPVQSKFGWHLIKVEDRRPVSPPSFKDVESDIQLELSSKVANDFLKELRGDADIKLYNMDGSEMKDKN
jgi:peptidyl-prolyl cis-trans isomerase C